MKKIFTLIIFVSFSTSGLLAQNDVSFSASDTWTGFMNVFDLPADGGGYQFGSAWDVAALQATLDGTANTIVLQPNFNTYEENPTDAYWVNQTTNEGNKDMEALVFVEPGATFNGVDLTFSGDVGGYSLDAAYTASFFIKALDPANGYADAFGGSKVVVLPASGPFTISATGAELATGLIIQYGFVVRGVNANRANEATLGKVTIGDFNTSTKNLDAQTSLTLSPNPATDLLSVVTIGEMESYVIHSLSGQVMLSGNNENSIDVSDLTAGMYLMVAQIGDRKEVVKFVKK